MRRSRRRRKPLGEDDVLRAVACDYVGPAECAINAEAGYTTALQLLFFFSRALTFFFFHLHETYDANSIQLIFSAVRRLRLESFAEARNRGLGRVPRLQQDPLRGEAASNTSSNTVGALSAPYVRWASELPLQRTTAFFSSENSFSPTRRI